MSVALSESYPSFFLLKKVNDLESAGSEKDNTGCLKNRVCPYMRAAPSVIALACCITGIVYALFIWESSYIAIGFSLGTLCSIYCIYLSFEFSNLKTFEENNSVLQKAITTLETENSELRTQVEQFKKQNQLLTDNVAQFKQLHAKLKEEIKRLGEQMVDFEKTNQTLHFQVESFTTENTQLTEKIQELQQLNEQITQRTQLQIEQFQQINESLQGIQSSATGNHVIFSEKILNFQEQLKNLETTRSEFEKASSDVEIKFKENVETLLSTGTMLSTIFQQISEWKNESAVSERIHQIQQMQQMQDETHKKQQQLQESLGELEKKISFANGQIEQLDTIRAGFEGALQSLIDNVSKFGQDREEMSQVRSEIIKITQIFTSLQEKRQSMEVKK